MFPWEGGSNTGNKREMVPWKGAPKTSSRSMVQDLAGAIKI